MNAYYAIVGRFPFDYDTTKTYNDVTEEEALERFTTYLVSEEPRTEEELCRDSGYPEGSTFHDMTIITVILKSNSPIQITN